MQTEARQHPPRVSRRANDFSSGSTSAGSWETLNRGGGWSVMRFDMSGHTMAACAAPRNRSYAVATVTFMSSTATDMVP